MIRRPPRSTLDRSSAASDVYKRQSPHRRGGRRGDETDDQAEGREVPPMKVVLFCGGLGMRLRDYSESIPKPMIPVGYRPILWHVMRYYAPVSYTHLTLPTS